MSRSKTDEYIKMGLRNDEPYSAWNVNEIHNDSRISDAMAARCIISDLVIGSTKRYSDLGQSFFVKSSGKTRSGNTIGNGRPWIYDYKYTTILRHVLKGSCTLDLKVGQDVAILSDHDAQFRRWATRVQAGDYSMFKWDLLLRNPAILRSLTTPSIPGSIGSDAPSSVGPYFGIPLHIFDPNSNVVDYVPAHIAILDGNNVNGGPQPINVRPNHAVPDAGSAPLVPEAQGIASNEAPPPDSDIHDDEPRATVNGIQTAKVQLDFEVSLEIACTAVGIIARVDQQTAKGLTNKLKGISDARLAKLSASIDGMKALP